MANLKIIYSNATDRTTSLTASTTAGTFVAANLKTDIKGQVHRSTGTSVSFTATWTNAQLIGAVAIPACNLTATSTIRVRRYSDTAGTTLIDDSGTISACPNLDLGLLDWGSPLNANAFAYGGASKTAVFFSSNNSNVRRVLVDLVDTSNPIGYIDTARLVIGPFWSPSTNASYGAENQIEDRSINTRNDAGDLLTDRGTFNDRLSFSLEFLRETDRAALNRIIRNLGVNRNFFCSLLPDNPSDAAEQDFMIFGKRSNSSIVLDRIVTNSNKIDIEGW